MTHTWRGKSRKYNWDTEIFCVLVLNTRSFTLKTKFSVLLLLLLLLWLLLFSLNRIILRVSDPFQPSSLSRHGLFCVSSQHRDLSLPFSHSSETPFFCPMQNGASGRRVQGFDSWERGGGGGFTDCEQRSAPQCVLDTGLCISTWFRSSYTRRSTWRTSRQAACLNFQVVWLWMNELYLFSWINNRSKLTPLKRKLQWVWAQLSVTLLTQSWRS